MKKIMFNESYGLTEAVLQGRKTMTRRLISNKQAIYSLDEQEFIGQLAVSENFVKKYSRYQVGEIVAIAQSYKDVYDEMKNPCELFYDRLFYSILKEHKGWNNKMFVKAEFMPHRIRFTDLKVERLQDISDEDCAKEGVRHFIDYSKERIERFYIDAIPNYHPGSMTTYDSVKEAFAALIDKVSGSGTWERNPWVFAYTYELVK